MLHKTALPTQRTLRLLSRPVTDAHPAEDMSAGRDTGILHLFQTQSALPVAASYPAHCLLVLKLVLWLIVRWCVRPLL